MVVELYEEEVHGEEFVSGVSRSGGHGELQRNKSFEGEGREQSNRYRTLQNAGML